MSDDRPEDEIRESWEKVQAAHLVVREAEAKVARHQTDLKKAKAALELAVLKRDALLNGETKEYPLFDGEDKEDQAEQPVGDPNAWREVTIQTVMASQDEFWELITTSQDFAEIKTVGELFDLLTLAEQTFPRHPTDQGPRRGYLVDDVFDPSSKADMKDAEDLTAKLIEWGKAYTPSIEWELILRPRPKTWRDLTLDELLALPGVPTPQPNSVTAKAFEKLAKKNYHQTAASLARAIEADWTPRQFGLTKDELAAVVNRLEWAKNPPEPTAENDDDDTEADEPTTA